MSSLQEGYNSKGIMNIHLNKIQTQPELVLEAKWSASNLARKCGVSLRTLERYFLQELGKTPKAWLLEKRQQRAFEMLREGRSIKETATYLGYKYPTHFARAFKNFWGSYPVCYKLAFSDRKTRVCRKMVVKSRVLVMN